MQRKSCTQISFNIYQIIWLQGWGRPTQPYQGPKSAPVRVKEKKLNAFLLALNSTRIPDKENYNLLLTCTCVLLFHSGPWRNQPATWPVALSCHDQSERSSASPSSGTEMSNSFCFIWKRTDNTHPHHMHTYGLKRRLLFRFLALFDL